MELGLNGKKALVTGGSAGIGFAIALELCKEGAQVTLASRSHDRLESAKTAILKAVPGAEITIRLIDLEKPDSISAFLKDAGTDFDIWIQNTGGPAPGQALKLELSDWDRGYQSLVRSLLQISHALIPAMMKRGWGRVVNITSTSALELIPNLPVSGLFRSGLSSWVKTVAKEAGAGGVLVNNVLPGPTRTQRLKELETGSPEFYNSMAQRSALGRIAEPEEIARIVVFLASSANGYLTGCDVCVDGGATTAL